MNELVPITHIDLAVHFDWKRAFADYELVSTEDDMRLQRCRGRLLDIARNPLAVVFYFSSFLENHSGRLQKGRSVVDRPAYLQDIIRILEYQKLLGNRFFLWAGQDDPSRDQLIDLFQSRGFTFDADHTILSAYGEYLEWCVLGKQRVIQDALDLEPANCHLLANLSKT